MFLHVRRIKLSNNEDGAWETRGVTAVNGSLSSLGPHVTYHVSHTYRSTHHTHAAMHSSRRATAEESRS